jgi:hypothetical protein
MGPVALGYPLQGTQARESETQARTFSRRWAPTQLSHPDPGRPALVENFKVPGGTSQGHCHGAHSESRYRVPEESTCCGPANPGQGLERNRIG